MKVVIAEKPSVAKDIAALLNANERKDGYFQGSGYQVTWAFGHLVELAPPAVYDARYKNWEIDDLPILPEKFKLQLKSDSGAQKQFATIKKLFSAASEIICATDAGREGELIYRLIYEASGVNNLNQKRLWISSLTDQAIKEGFNNLTDINKWQGLADAAISRSEADWLTGLNFTRLYTTKYSTDGALSVGRVQTPILAMIVRRHNEISSFKPTPYWVIETLYRETKFKAQIDSFTDKVQAEEFFSKLENHKELKILKVEKTKKIDKAPQLYDLTTLQREVNREHKFSAEKTLRCVQELYEAKLLTYPRTDSRYLSTDMKPEIAKVMNKLKHSYSDEVEQLDLTKLNFTKRIFNDAKVSDHHAIIPTGNNPDAVKLGDDQKLVYDIVSRRFLAAFFPDCEKESTVVQAQAGETPFKTSGSVITLPGWRTLYPTTKDKESLPVFVEGESGLHTPELVKKMTKPPSKFTEDSLLAAMEVCGKEVEDEALREALKEKGLGTPATRHSILPLLIKRGYVKMAKNIIEATGLGVRLVQLLDDSPLASPEMTGEWESKFGEIEKGKLSRSEFMAAIADFTKKITEDVKSAQAQTLRSKEVLGSCPICNSGKVTIGPKRWACDNDTCKFALWTEAGKKKVTEKQLLDLFSKGKTALIQGFRNKENKKFSAYLIVTKEGKMTFEFPPKELIGICPACEAGRVERSDSGNARCSDKECKFIIWGEIASKKIKASHQIALLSNRKTEIIDGFINSEKKSFAARLILNDDNEVKFSFLGDKIGECPLCDGNILDGIKVAKCDNDDCEMKIWKTVFSKKLKESDIKALLENGKTDLIRNFKTKNGKLTFDAAIKLEESGNMVLSYPEVDLGPCPKCSSAQVRNRGPVYKCISDDCDFAIFNEMAKRRFSDEEISSMLKNGKTSVLDGFLSKDKKTFSCAIKIVDGKTAFDFDSDNIELKVSCPTCQGVLTASNKKINCNSCQWSLWREVAGLQLSEDQLNTIIAEGEIDKLDGLTSQKGKSYSAPAKIIEENGRFKIKLIFPDKE